MLIILYVTEYKTIVREDAYEKIAKFFSVFLWQQKIFKVIFRDVTFVFYIFIISPSFIDYILRLLCVKYKQDSRQD